MRPTLLVPPLAVALLGVVSCADTTVSDPNRADTCEELTEASVAVARSVLDELGSSTVAELEAANPDDPFAAVRALQRADEFEARARSLGCGDDALLDCARFAELDELAGGEAADAYLRPYRSICD